MRRVVHLSVAALLVVSGVGVSIHAQAGSAATLAGLCNPVRVTTCALPFPSDLWTTSDPSSATGRRVGIRDGILSPRFLAQIPTSVRPGAVFGGKTGFSAAGPVLFEVNWPIDPTSLPRDGGTTAAVWDLTTGMRVDVLAEVDSQALTAPGGASDVVRVWPKYRFEFCHRYLAVLTTSLRRQDDGIYQPSEGFVAVVHGGNTPLARHYRPLLAFLGQRGLDAAQLLSATDFTVRSRDEVQAPMLDMTRKAFAAQHPVQVQAVLPGLLPDVGAIAYGRIRLTDFRSGDPGGDGGVHWTPAAQGHDNWTDFYLFVPASAASRPAPVVVYGHGLDVVKETGFFSAARNAVDGLATIMIDQPNHGTRGQADGGYLTDIMTPSNTARLAAIVDQSTIDMTSVVKAVETSLAGLDVVPWPSGDGRADLDARHVAFEGTSMGGVLGAAFLAYAPDVEAGVLEVSGAGVMHILTGSAVWEEVGFDHVLPPDVSGAEQAVGVAGIQELIDPGDAVNGADEYGSRRVLLVYGEQDGIVPNYGSERLASLAQLPRITSPGLPPGLSAVYMEPRPDVPDFIWRYLAHTSFVFPRPAAAIDNFWAGYVQSIGH